MSYVSYVQRIDPKNRVSLLDRMAQSQIRHGGCRRLPPLRSSELRFGTNKQRMSHKYCCYQEKEAIHLTVRKQAETRRRALKSDASFHDEDSSLVSRIPGICDAISKKQEETNTICTLAQSRTRRTTRTFRPRCSADTTSQTSERTRTMSAASIATCTQDSEGDRRTHTRGGRKKKKVHKEGMKLVGKKENS